MKTLAVLSRKGGAGKTTVALNLAMAARQAGLKVVVADIDPIRSAGEVLRRREEANSFLFETTASKLFLLQDACRRNRCDLLIIDTPTGPEGDIVLAANLADLCLVVARPSRLDLAAVRESLALVKRVGRPGLVVLNQCPPLRDEQECAVVARAVEGLQGGPLPVARSRLRSRIGYQHACAHNCGVTEWDQGSEAATDVLRLLAEVSDELVLTRAGAAATNDDFGDLSDGLVRRPLQALRRLVA